jgi:hypothetical protein
VGAISGTVGRWLARYLSKPVGVRSVSTSEAAHLAATLRPADVLLVEGNTRISRVIKTLTQSNWSHAALYVGPRTELGRPDLVFVEADLRDGVRAVPLAEYAGMHTRICRPAGLTPEDRERILQFVLRRIGHQYDMKNVIDLARYLLPAPPVPRRFRRRLLALGSGDPTRAICSTLIAQAFQSVRFPILPDVRRQRTDDPDCDDCYQEILHIRHYSLFAPRDFDLSPYFTVVKPTLEASFDYRALAWHPDSPPAGAPH